MNILVTHGLSSLIISSKVKFHFGSLIGGALLDIYFQSFQTCYLSKLIISKKLGQVKILIIPDLRSPFLQ